MYKYSPFQMNKDEMPTTISVIDVMKKIMDRKNVAVDLHHRLTLIFSYLNFRGFKKMQEYRHIVESMDLLDLEKKFMKKYSKIYIGDGSKVVINPMNIMECENNFNIPVDKKRQIVKSLFEMWYNWEIETKKIMCEYLNEISSQDDSYDVACILEKEIKCVDKEIFTIKTYMNELSDADWCIKHMYSMQKHLHEKYEEEIEEFFED